MKTNELMIGDWVCANRSECVADGGRYQKWQQIGKVKYIQEDVVAVRFDEEDDWEEFLLNEVNPIPLTEEILVKNGFEKDERSKYFHVYTLNIKGSYDFDICWSSVNGFNYEGDFMLTYVHQLQHLLRLCGIEKEIEL